MSPIETKTASPKDTRNVLRMTLATRGQPAVEVDRLVSGFMQYAREMSLDLTRQWLCMADARMIAACNCIESPGRTAMLLLPDSEVSEAGPETISCLVRQVIGEESRRDVRLLQCLTRPGDLDLQAALAGVGFRDIATLSYMEWRAAGRKPPPAPGGPARLRHTPKEWITYDDAHHGEFARLIEETYRGSLDCPDLCGLRDIDDVIAGHKSAGRFIPRRWLLLRCHGQAAGCILFGETPLRPALELVYMGVHPDWRGMGVGQYILFRGLSLAGRERFETVTLAVDEANAPARALYDGAGFRETTRRRAMIRVMQPSSSRS